MRILLIITLSIPAVAGDQCLVVYPMKECFVGGYCGLRYSYAGSEGLPIAKVKDRYTKKDVEKLESAGVNIVTIPRPAAINVKSGSSLDVNAVHDACRTKYAQ